MLIWSTIWATKNAALQLQNSYEYIWELLRSTSQSGPDVSSASINHAGQGGSGLSTLPFNLDMNQRQCGECLSATRKLYWMFDSNLIFVHQHSDTSFWKQGFIEKSNLLDNTHFFFFLRMDNFKYSNWIYRHVRTVTVVPQSHANTKILSQQWSSIHEQMTPKQVVFILFENTPEDLWIINSMNQHLTDYKFSEKLSFSVSEHLTCITTWLVFIWKLKIT